jgi:hypothetical protein
MNSISRSLSLVQSLVQRFLLLAVARFVTLSLCWTRACMLCCPSGRQEQHSSLQSTPGKFTAYFQWCESTARLGTAYETQRVRSAVDAASVFRQASLFKWASPFGCVSGRLLKGNCRSGTMASAGGNRARAAFAEDESRGRRDCEGDCRPWCIAICFSDAAIHNSVAF